MCGARARSLHLPARKPTARPSLPPKPHSRARGVKWILRCNAVQELEREYRAPLTADEDLAWASVGELSRALLAPMIARSILHLRVCGWFCGFMRGVFHRVVRILHRVLGVLHRVLGVLHRVVGALHRVLGMRIGYRGMGVWGAIPEPHIARRIRQATPGGAGTGGLRQPPQVVHN